MNAVTAGKWRGLGLFLGLLLLRCALRPGRENGRPLEKDRGKFWILREGYPFSGYRLPGAAGAAR